MRFTSPGFAAVALLATFSAAAPVAPNAEGLTNSPGSDDLAKRHVWDLLYERDEQEDDGGLSKRHSSRYGWDADDEEADKEEADKEEADVEADEEEEVDGAFSKRHFISYPYQGDSREADGDLYKRFLEDFLYEGDEREAQ